MSNKIADALHSGRLSRAQQLLVCLASLGDGTHQPAAVRSVLSTNGLPGANLARDLGRLKGLAYPGKMGWTLTTEGRTQAAAILGESNAAPQATTLRALLPKLEKPVRSFLAEAVACYEEKHYRAAVVLSWVGAVSVLYHLVIANHLAEFNKEATRRDAKWRTAKTTDDIARMKEYDFLQVLEAISIIGKNVKTELEGCLKLRNACGHPNSLKIAEHRCASHIEILILNVFEAYA